MADRLLTILIFILSLATPVRAETYHLDIARKMVNITGREVEKITINGDIPGPTLRFTEGEEAVITVTNHMREDTSIHWHGLLVPGVMDGVPGLNGFDGIAPGETFTYHFPLRQSGTYWYHAHSLGQEQDGNYGSLVIAPKHRDPIRADRDYVVLLSDFALENSDQILANLKSHSAFYNYSQRTVGDFFNDVKQNGFAAAWENTREWGEMRMSPTDLSDVSGYHFLINGKTAEQNWTGLFKPGEKVRLRFINASSMSIYDVRIPGLKLNVVQSDGQNVEPLAVDEFRFGVAETYDVIVEPKEDRAYTIVAEPIDRTGFALGTLAPREGMRGEIPEHRPRALLTMADMGMNHEMAGMDMPGMDMSAMMGNSGWSETGTPPGAKALDYKDLRYRGRQRDLRQPEHEVVMHLGGNMERYIWTLNGKKHEDADPIVLKYGERVRLKFVNETMMAHPMHMHGMFVQLENGQPADKLPNKHTIIIPPGQTYSVLFTANEPGEWAFHCHLLYHMLSGMMTTVVVPERAVDGKPPAPVPSHKGHHHAH